MSDEEPISGGTFMEKGTAYIKNPLGIIGLFIALIYSVALFVVGFSSNLTEGMRWAFVLFAVLFPPGLLGVFYRLVTRHHSKLYAPTDWKDERLVFGPQTAEVREQREEAEAQLLQVGVKQTETQSTESQGIEAPPKHSVALPGIPKQESAKLLARRAEDLAFKWLAPQFPGEEIYRNASLDGVRGPVAFDGFVARPQGKHLIAIEVKVIRDSRAVSKIVSEFEKSATSALANVRAVEKPGTIAFMLIIVTIDSDPELKSRVEDLARQILTRHGLNVDLRVVDMDELRAFDSV